MASESHKNYHCFCSTASNMASFWFYQSNVCKTSTVQYFLVWFTAKIITLLSLSYSLNWAGFWYIEYDLLQTKHPFTTSETTKQPILLTSMLINTMTYRTHLLISFSSTQFLNTQVYFCILQMFVLVIWNLFNTMEIIHCYQDMGENFEWR